MSDIYFLSHMLGRLTFSLALFAAVPGASSFQQLAGLLLLGSLLVRLQGDSWRPLVRAGKLLPWLLIPIIVMHMLFTPGRMLWPAAGIPVSAEGLREGAWLALRLATLFVAAMGMSRALTHQEWLYAAARIPGIGKKLAVYLRLAGPLHETVMREIRGRGLRPLNRLPQTLAGLFHDVWQVAGETAGKVWSEWERFPELRENRYSVVGGAMVAAGGVMLLYSAW